MEQNVDRDLLLRQAELLKALGHPVRLCIVKGLFSNGERNVQQMQICLVLPQSTLSQHLGKLRNAGIVRCRRQGTEVFYELSNTKVRNIIQLLESEID